MLSSIGLSVFFFGFPLNPLHNYISKFKNEKPFRKTPALRAISSDSQQSLPQKWAAFVIPILLVLSDPFCQRLETLQVTPREVVERPTGLRSVTWYRNMICVLFDAVQS